MLIRLSPYLALDFTPLSIALRDFCTSICRSGKPTTGLEPVNLILTKDALYQLSYMGILCEQSG